VRGAWLGWAGAAIGWAWSSLPHAADGCRRLAAAAGGLFGSGWQPCRGGDPSLQPLALHLICMLASWMMAAASKF